MWEGKIRAANSHAPTMRIMQPTPSTSSHTTRPFLHAVKSFKSSGSGTASLPFLQHHTGRQEWSWVTMVTGRSVSPHSETFLRFPVIVCLVSVPMQIMDVIHWDDPQIPWLVLVSWFKLWCLKAAGMLVWLLTWHDLYDPEPCGG